MKKKNTPRIDFNYTDDAIRQMDVRELRYIIGMGITGKQHHIAIETLAKKKEAYR